MNSKFRRLLKHLILIFATAIVFFFLMGASNLAIFNKLVPDKEYTFRVGSYVFKGKIYEFLGDGWVTIEVTLDMGLNLKSKTVWVNLDQASMIEPESK